MLTRVANCSDCKQQFKIEELKRVALGLRCAACHAAFKARVDKEIAEEMAQPFDSVVVRGRNPGDAPELDEDEIACINAVRAGKAPTTMPGMVPGTLLPRGETTTGGPTAIPARFRPRVDEFGGDL